MALTVLGRVSVPLNSFGTPYRNFLLLFLLFLLGERCAGELSCDVEGAAADPQGGPTTTNPTYFFSFIDIFSSKLELESVYIRSRNSRQNI